MKVAVVRYAWRRDAESAPTAEGPWSQEVFEEILASPTNGWSLRSYWEDCTFGLFVPEFDLGIALSSPQPAGAPVGWHEWAFQPPRPGGRTRGHVIAAAIEQAHQEGLSQSIEHVV